MHRRGVRGGGPCVRPRIANLFTIADLPRVWVLCDVYEDALMRVHVGDTAEIRANAIPDNAFKGKVSNISRVLDPATRSAKVRIEIANPGQVCPSHNAMAGPGGEEVEQQVTIPLETQSNGVGHKTHLQSRSLAGISVVTVEQPRPGDRSQTATLTFAWVRQRRAVAAGIGVVAPGNW